jgi:DivIVA domain-containing protein
MNVSPLDLRQQRFSTAFRGLDPIEVTSFLAAVADDYEQALREADRLRDEVGRLEQLLRGHVEQERSLQNTLVTAQKVADDRGPGPRRRPSAFFARPRAGRKCCCRRRRRASRTSSETSTA